jgi:hypothetical protein
MSRLGPTEAVEPQKKEGIYRVFKKELYNFESL